MNQEKYIGMDVHAATISAAVMNAQGKVLTKCVMETKASTILEFIQAQRGTLAVTFEGTMAAWLHDLLKPHVSRLVVCDPRKNALMRDGNQNDRADARNLAELLRTNQVHAVYPKLAALFISSSQLHFSLRSRPHQAHYITSFPVCTFRRLSAVPAADLLAHSPVHPPAAAC